MLFVPYLFVFMAGLMIGSFLNVLIHRLPRGRQFVKGRSSCPDCGQMIKWYHNIPLLSYLFLRGKCAHCRKPISFRYPLVELLNGMGYLYFFWEQGWSIDFGSLSFSHPCL